jgi:hypothetical protein
LEAGGLTSFPTRRDDRERLVSVQGRYHSDYRAFGREGGREGERERGKDSVTPRKKDAFH